MGPKEIDMLDQMTVADALEDAALLWERRANEAAGRGHFRVSQTRMGMALDARRIRKMIMTEVVMYVGSIDVDSTEVTS
jgi:hypothetical protein